MRQQNYFWFCLATLIANSIFFGAAIARYTDGQAFDKWGVIGSAIFACASAAGICLDRAQGAAE